jgi:hypothetical protein
MVANDFPADGDEDFRSSHDRLSHRNVGPDRLARLLARARFGSLDKALIAGADPAASPQLAARAARLTEPRYRASVALGIERLLETAQGRRRRRTVLPRGGHLLVNETELHALAAELRGGTPLYARGIAMMGRLLTDGSGPAYLGDADALARSLRDADAAMSGQETADPVRSWGSLRPRDRAPGTEIDDADQPQGGRR